ncbi:MAG: ABC transporter ATP-binding protein [Anaerolineaceae bacterium]|nr:ABC transporter ATP-binding protein [Anaerolineaceae bacterium]
MTQAAKASPSNVVEMKQIVKSFPGVLANDHVDFSLRRGEIHALLGENGAGKSTLMNILSGLYKPDSGTILVNGIRETLNSPRDAINAGIGMVHQHFMLVPSLTVTENILLGLSEPAFVMNLRGYDQKIAEMGAKYGLEVDPTAKIWQLSVGEQQRVELLKLLYRGAQILILDEPTAVLAPVEIHDLFSTLRGMVAEGKSIIFISHKLNEVMEISDRLSVLRKGIATASGISMEGVSRRDLANLMVGRDVIFEQRISAHEYGPTVLEMKDVWAENEKRLDALRGVGLTVRAGEIVGLAGVAGNGQNELAEVVAGLRKCKQGQVLIHGENITNQSIKKNIDRGVAYIPEDRTHVGSSPNLDITDNVIMKKYAKDPIGKGITVDMHAAVDLAVDLKDSYDIIAPSVRTPVRLLSGGNLQRMILARELSANPPFLVAMQPTRGLDVGAIEGVQSLLLQQREQGAAILLISEELDELIRLSDRIYIIYEGEIMGEMTEITGDDNCIEQIGMMMTGSRLRDLEGTGGMERNENEPQ